MMLTLQDRVVLYNTHDKRTPSYMHIIRLVRIPELDFSENAEGMIGADAERCVYGNIYRRDISRANIFVVCVPSAPLDFDKNRLGNSPQVMLPLVILSPVCYIINIRK